jgi:oligoribonuclease NrnB/cAMP/cGMP phosphodiesterase (DHH superfamily)
MALTLRNPVVLYHSACKDGFASAWAHHRSVAGTDEIVDYVPVYHDTPPPLFMLKDRDVVMLDFTYKREPMAEVGRVARKLVVLDHHQSASDDLAGFIPQCPQGSEVIFDMGRSGAGMTWDYFNPHTKRPWLIDYVEDRDLWRHALPHSGPVNAYISALAFDFKVWDDEAASDFDDLLIARGKAIQAKTRQYVREVIKNAREMLFEEHVVPVVNAPQHDISELLMFLGHDYPFSVGWCQLADGTFKYSLRTGTSPDRVDVSEIAKKHGGGGHKGSAAFQATTPVHLSWPVRELR